MNKTAIDWCDMSWNPVTGCLHGCEYCYARKIANRFAGKAYKQNKDIFANDFKATLGMPDRDKAGHIVPFPHGFLPTIHKYRLDEPTKEKKPQKIFVCSMADLFGDWVPDEWIKEVFEACRKAPQHAYLFLTKNPKRYGNINGWNHFYDWSIAEPNWWFGITVTCQDDLFRLRELPYGKANTFISIEPLQGSIDLSFYIPNKETICQCSYCGHHASYYSSHCQYCGKEGGYSGSFRREPINWVIIGQQTGPGAIRPREEWVAAVIDQCRAAGIPVFVKRPLYEMFPIQEWPEGLK